MQRIICPVPFHLLSLFFSTFIYIYIYIYIYREREREREREMIILRGLFAVFSFHRSLSGLSLCAFYWSVRCLFVKTNDCRQEFILSFIQSFVSTPANSVIYFSPQTPLVSFLLLLCCTPASRILDTVCRSVKLEYAIMFLYLIFRSP